MPQNYNINFCHRIAKHITMESAVTYISNHISGPRSECVYFFTHFFQHQIFHLDGRAMAHLMWVSWRMAVRCCWLYAIYDIESLVQDCSNSTANAVKLLQSCTKPPTLWYFMRLSTHFPHGWATGSLLWVFWGNEIKSWVLGHFVHIDEVKPSWTLPDTM